MESSPVEPQIVANGGQLQHSSGSDHAEASIGSFSAAASHGDAVTSQAPRQVRHSRTICPPGQGGNEDVEAEEEADEDEGAQEADTQNFKRTLKLSEMMLLDQLGAGAEGDVWRAIWWRKFGFATSAITVAVKRFHGNTHGARFEGEPLMHRIRHPNVLKIFEVTTKPPYLLVSEYCAGGSLHRCVHDSSIQISWPQRLKILLDVAKGMEYLHSNTPCILHRDLKSGNVLLTKPISDSNVDISAKVADFGLCRFMGLTSGAQMTRAVGTWRWMAPEVISCNTYDEKIDTFSFGMLMFEVLSREIPFADTIPLGNKDPRMALRIVAGLRPTAQLVQTGCPNSVAELMQDCWARNPEGRPDFTTVGKLLQSQLDLVATYNEDND